MFNRQEDVQNSFRVFQNEIDAYNDRRERLIKSSRDITTASKRLIFHLHRFPHQSLIISSSEVSKSEPRLNTLRSNLAEKVLYEAKTKKDEIVQMILQTAKREGLKRPLEVA